MGLFGKLKKTAEDAKNRVDNVKAQVTQIRGDINEAVDTITGKADTRPNAPQELLIHEQHECIKVYGVHYNQDKLSDLPGNYVELDIGTRLLKEGEAYPVMLANGEIIGNVFPEQLEKAGIKKGEHVLAEIHRPIYQMRDYIELYIPRTREAIEEEQKRDALKFWENIDATKWEPGDGERYDYHEVEVLTKNAKGKGKPTYVIIGDGVKLFEVGPRMKMYTELVDRDGYKPRRLIAERRTSDYGQYYHVGFYY